MCKVVYLTTKRFDEPSNVFKKALAQELRNRNVEVMTDNSYDFLNYLRKHKTFGIALAFDFYRDDEEGCGLTLNRNCSIIGRDFAYNLSNEYDRLTPRIHWRDFKYVESDDKEWFVFFNKVSATTKAIFYLCNRNNPVDWNIFSTTFKDIVKLFADEIIRCLRSDYNSDSYRKSVERSKLRINRVKE